MRSQDAVLTYSSLMRGLSNRLIIFLLLVLLTFLLPRLMPGDPVQVLYSGNYGQALTTAETEAIRESMGLSGSLWDQLFHYLGQLIQGNLGHSVHHAAPVSELLLSALPWTAFLLLLAFPIFLTLGIGLGIEAGRKPHKQLDQILTRIITMLGCVPPFVFAFLLLLLLSFLIPIFPSGGAEPLFPSSNPFIHTLEKLHHALLPAFALAMHEIVRLYFISRGESVKLSSRPFIKHATMRGIHGWHMRLHYYGRNLLPIIIARLSDTLPTLVSTILYIEVVFSYPGIGHLIYNAILERDFVLMQGAILGLAAIILLLNWLIDFASSVLAQRG